MDPIEDLLVLVQAPAIGAGRLRTLLTNFPAPADIFKASARELARLEGFSDSLASSTAQFLKRSDPSKERTFARQQITKAASAGGRILPFWNPEYPEMLKKIFDPPPCVFMKGQFVEADRYSVAIVGTRAPSDYGTAVTETFCEGLVGAGLTVVSGLARGVDTAAHWTALRKGGRTIAVIGSGIDVIYPPENRQLSEQISACGVLMSEVHMGGKPDAANFPKRNRLISGLSLGTVVVETDLHGGAMITARAALDQDREVFAVPGPIGSRRSRGCNALIREGKAKLVDSVEDVLVELTAKLPRGGIPGSPKGEPCLAELTLFERAIVDRLEHGPLHIDVLATHSGLLISELLSQLLTLEMKGYVRQLPGKIFRLK